MDQECPTCSSKSLRGSVYRPECEGCYWFDDNADVNVYDNDVNDIAADLVLIVMMM